MPDGDIDLLRRELKEIGERRRLQHGYNQTLMENTREIVARAQGKLPITEIAKLVGVERTVLYRTYLP